MNAIAPQNPVDAILEMTPYAVYEMAAGLSIESIVDLIAQLEDFIDGLEDSNAISLANHADVRLWKLQEALELKDPTRRQAQPAQKLDLPF